MNVWFTGRPAAGNTTVATAVVARLRTLGRSAQLLDGDLLLHLVIEAMCLALLLGERPDGVCSRPLRTHRRLREICVHARLLEQHT
jgi:hypothetical protein